MFEIYLLKDCHWVPYFKSDDIDKIDDALQGLLEKEPGGHVQYFEDGKLLTLLALNEYHYNWWKETFYNLKNNKYRRLTKRDSKYDEYN